MENREQKAGGVRLSGEQIEEYLGTLRASGCTPSTLGTYQRSLERFYQFLGGDKTVRPGTLAAWQAQLVESGYSTKTANVCTYAANGLLLYLGHGDLRAKRLKEEEKIQPELTRAEYLRLLSAARRLNREKAYLLVKLFGTTGISIGDLKNLTAEAVQKGKVISAAGPLPIPDGLKAELEQYMEQNYITTGPVFLTKSGKPMDRDPSKLISRLSRDAQVPEEKANQRCLHKLYLSTQAGLQENFSILVEQAYARLLEKEQRSIAWKQ